MYDVVSDADVIGDAEPHIIEFWYSEDFSDYLLVNKSLNGTKYLSLVC